MIPILFEGNVQSFTNNGLGRLADAITCKVTEERNGQFELELTYPITGIHYADIQENRIIFAKTEDGGSNQAFIIYKISKPLNGIVTVNAQHISYLLNGFVVMPFTAVSCADAISKIAANTVISTPFAYHTDVESTVSFNLDAPRSVRGLLGGEQGSLLDTYGGYDYKFDNFDVYLYTNRGQDNGVSIRYGKNLIGLKSDVDATGVYTGIVPFWQDSESGDAVYLPEKYVLSDHASDYPYKIIKTVDFSNEFETEPTASQLRQKAQNYITSSNAWKIKNSIDVSFIDLAQTDEYKNIAPLERVKLCDLVTVVYSKLGVDVKTKVIKTVYNVLKERYDSISLGDTTYTLAKAIQEVSDNALMSEVNTNLKAAIARATKLIQGGLGGHVVFNTNADGEPEEILIMDTDDITTAVNVIRMNLGGIGFSHNGYEGPFNTAWTIDGHFVADYIDTGTLNGNLIRANTIQASALTLEAKEELAAVHSYLYGDIFTNINRWQVWNPAPMPTYETIDDKTYLVFDGTGINAFNLNYRCFTEMISLGDLKINVHFKYHIDREVNLTDAQRFLFVTYTRKSDGDTIITYRNMPAQVIPANTDFTWDISFDITDVSDSVAPCFGFYAIPTCKIYLEEVTVTSTLEQYTKAGLTFCQEGLQLNANAIETNNTHNFVPFDVTSNLARWQQVERSTISGTGSISFETITVDGVNKTAICLDGTNLISGDLFYAFNTDFIGSVQYHWKFKYQVANDVTGEVLLFGVAYKMTDGTAIWNWRTRIPSGTTRLANTEYSTEYTATTENCDYYAQIPQFWFRVIPATKFYIYDLEIVGEETQYKSAALTFTADGLNSVVQAGSIISSINQSAEAVTIKADKIDLSGNLNLTGDFVANSALWANVRAELKNGNLSLLQNDNVLFEVKPVSTAQGLTASLDIYDENGNYLSYMTGESVKGNNLIGYNLSLNDDGRVSYIYPSVVFGLAGTQNTYTFYGDVINSTGGTVFRSDRRKKKNIKDLAIDKAKSFLMALKPRAFKFKDGTSGRYHHGFIAQEVKESMGGDDWGLYVENKDMDFIGLRYDEIIADLVKVVQDQEKRIQELERKMEK